MNTYGIRNREWGSFRKETESERKQGQCKRQGNPGMILRFFCVLKNLPLRITASQYTLQAHKKSNSGKQEEPHFRFDFQSAVSLSSKRFWNKSNSMTFAYRCWSTHFKLWIENEIRGKGGRIRCHVCAGERISREVKDFAGGERRTRVCERWGESIFSWKQKKRLGERFFLRGPHCRSRRVYTCIRLGYF